MDENINLQEIIKLDSIIYKSSATNKEQILNELASKLFDLQIVSSIDGFLEDVYLREQEGITGIGSQIAIPHGKSPYVEKTSIAVALLNSDIEWESLDEMPVKLVFLFAVSDEDKGNKHLCLLQKIAVKLAHENFIEKLINSQSKEQIYELICE